MIARPLGVAAAFCLCLVVTASAAPRKKTKPAHRAAASARPAARPAKAAAPNAAASAPSATPAPGDIVLYGGGAPSVSGLTLATFGGGAVEDNTDQSFAKGHSVKITTLDAYQGATLTFATPPSLGDLSDKARFLAFTLRLGSILVTAGDPAAAPGPAMGGGPDDQGGPYNPGAPGAGASSSVAPPVQNVHLILTLANGSKADLLRPLPGAGDAQSGADQWVNVAVPLAALGLPAGTTSPLQSVTLAGDDYAEMYVGQIKETRDDTPLTCFAGDQQTVGVGQPVTLKGSGGGGLSALHYAWTLDDTPGAPEQASGPVVTTAYLNAGDHKVTLTVSDLDGLKKPATATTVIHVQ